MFIAFIACDAILSTVIPLGYVSLVINQLGIAFYCTTLSLPVVRLLTMLPTSTSGILHLERLAFDGVCVMINLHRQFQQQKAHTFYTQTLTVLTEAMRLWSLTLVVFVVTSPLLPLIVYSVSVVNGEACTPTSTFASVAYTILNGLLTGAAPMLTLTWCYGFRKSFTVSFALYAVLKIGTDVVVRYLRLSDMRLHIATGLLVFYWVVCCGYHFMKLQETSVRRTVLYYLPFPLLVGTTVVTMHHVFRIVKGPVFLYAYRFVLHPVWYWLCIRLCGWLVLCGFSKATGPSPILAVPFVFMCTKNMIGRYVQTQLPYAELTISVVLLAVLELVAYATYPLRRKWLIMLVPKVRAVSTSSARSSPTTVVAVAAEASNEDVAANPADKGTRERSNETTGSAEPKMLPICPDVSHLSISALRLSQDSGRCTPESEPRQHPICKDRQTRPACRDLIYPSPAVGTATNRTIAWPADEDPSLAAQGSLVDNLHVATLLADIILEPLIILQISACKFLFIGSNDLPSAESYESIAITAACILAVQAVTTVLLLWWTRYKHNLSVPELTRYIGWRRCAVALVCLASVLAMTCLRVITVAGQGLDYNLPFCT